MKLLLIRTSELNGELQKKQQKGLAFHVKPKNTKTKMQKK